MPQRLLRQRELLDKQRRKEQVRSHTLHISAICHTSRAPCTYSLEFSFLILTQPAPLAPSAAGGALGGHGDFTPHFPHCHTPLFLYITPILFLNTNPKLQVLRQRAEEQLAHEKLRRQQVEYGGRSAHSERESRQVSNSQFP